MKTLDSTRLQSFSQAHFDIVPTLPLATCSGMQLALTHQSSVVEEIRRAASVSLFFDAPPLKSRHRLAGGALVGDMNDDNIISTKISSAPFFCIIKKLFQAISLQGTQVDFKYFFTPALVLILSLVLFVRIFIFSFVVWRVSRPRGALAHVNSRFRPSRYHQVTHLLEHLVIHEDFYCFLTMRRHFTYFQIDASFPFFPNPISPPSLA